MQPQEQRHLVNLLCMLCRMRGKDGVLFFELKIDKEHGALTLHRFATAKPTTAMQPYSRRSQT